MTANSIAYSKAKEDERHNRVMESLTRVERDEAERHNRKQEMLSHAQNQVNRANVYEVRRHNEAVEEETRSNNTILRMIEWAKAKEDERHNVRNEEISERNADVNWYNADTNRKALEETVRSNQVRETQNQQSIENSFIIGSKQVQAAFASASATRYAASVNSAAARYSADKSYEASIYKTDQERLTGSEKTANDKYRNKTDRLQYWLDYSDAYYITPSSQDKGNKIKTDTAKSATEAAFIPFNAAGTLFRGFGSLSSWAK